MVRGKSRLIAYRTTSGRLALRGGWKATALEADDVKVETATEGGRGFMTAWKKEGEDARLDIARRKEGFN